MHVLVPEAGSRRALQLEVFRLVLSQPTELALQRGAINEPNESATTAMQFLALDRLSATVYTRTNKGKRSFGKCKATQRSSRTPSYQTKTDSGRNDPTYIFFAGPTDVVFALPSTWNTLDHIETESAKVCLSWLSLPKIMKYVRRHLPPCCLPSPFERPIRRSPGSVPSSVPRT